MRESNPEGCFLALTLLTQPRRTLGRCFALGQLRLPLEPLSSGGPVTPSHSPAQDAQALPGDSTVAGHAAFHSFQDKTLGATTQEAGLHA